MKGETSRPGTRRRWQRLLQIGVSLGAIAFVIYRAHPADIARELSHARASYMALAIALYLVGQLISTYRWRRIGRSVGLSLVFLSYLRFYFVGMFFNFFGPSTLGGDLVRGLYLTEATARRALAFNSVLFDRLAGLVVLVAIGAAAFVVFPQYGLPRPLFLVTIAMGAGRFAGWWMAPRLAVWLLPASNRSRRLVAGDLGPFWFDRAMLLEVAGVSLVFHSLQILAQLAVSKALGLDIPLSYICIFHPLVSVISAIPVSLSGIGLREGGYLYFLKHIGTPAPLAVAYGVAWLLVMLACGLIGGVVFLASGARLPRLTVPRDLAGELRAASPES